MAGYKSTVSAAEYNDSIKQPKSTWVATYKILTPNTALFEVMTPPDIPVGIWEMSVQYADASVLCCNTLCILFNPWNEGDETFYPDKSDLEEYVLNELAIIPKWHRKDAWLLDQFSAVCLQSVLILLSLSQKDQSLKADQLGSAFAVVKALATAISKYVLETRWNELEQDTLKTKYDNLENSWTGSKEILVAHGKTGIRIGYGHSWCYAGLLTSLCRCIGVPCRMVTIYNFAPDVDEDMLVKLDLFDDMLAERSKDIVCCPPVLIISDN
ncbi:unnamed protein product [Gongylonema pulchrum]|uniref:TGc domain-containing protein n=1 Tax=Gongylonema pulchrum TaxID=637853 RepID=A0A183D638_9BILA|nr:unnamed protein product [Gongylonema pulchrum]